METIEKRLKAISAQRVLDLATGSGSFAATLAAGLAGYGEIVAIDSQAKALAAARKSLAELPRARVEEADASALPFPDASFDLVSVANSLHHFPRPEAVLAEACRVLAPGGRLLVLEMHREAADETRLTHVLLHHWWAAIDSLGGTFHAETYDKAGIKALLAPLPLVSAEWLEVEEGGEGPLDPELLKEIDGVIESYIGKIPADAPGAGALAARGAELRERAHRVGFRSAPSLFFVGTRAR